MIILANITEWTRFILAILANSRAITPLWDLAGY